MDVLYKTNGTCSVAIEVNLDDRHVIQDVRFIGGCKGNTVGVAALAKGQKAEDVIERLRGITCGSKATSCPDQLSCALEYALSETKSK